MHDAVLVENSYDSLPVFPLPNFAMFPHTITRLHVFEPRYRMMVADTLSTNQLLVLVGLKTGWERDYYGSPPVHEIGALCKIINYERLEDGRYTLFLHSLARVRLQTIHQLMPFRTAMVEVLPEDLGEDLVALDDTMKRLEGCVRGLILQLGDRGVDLGKAISSSRKPEILVNRLATALATSPEDRQALLEISNICDRAEKLREHASDLLLQASEAEDTMAEGDLSMLN